MTDGFIVIILVMFGCIGLGVILGWVLRGSDVKYYKNLAETYKNKLKYQDFDEKKVIIRYLKSRYLKRCNE